MSSPSVIQLRQLLAEKFPGLRQRMEEQPAVKDHFWPTTLPQLDKVLNGGLSFGSLTEVVTDSQHCGGATTMRALLHQVAAENKIAALIDGRDSFEVTQLPQAVLSRLLWIRCHTAEESLKAADILLRDANLPVVLLDLKLNPERELRKISATIWYRFQRLVEETAAICLVFTSRPMISAVQTRITLRSRFSLDVLEREPHEILRRLEFQVSDARQLEKAESAQNIA